MAPLGQHIARARARPASIGARRLEGIFSVPPQAGGLVIFAHGSGSSRLSPRNTYVAERLHERGLSTLLFDLLTEEEAADRRNVFDIPLLAARMGEAIAWASADTQASALPIGLFGASTGSAAALMAAARSPESIAAVVSRGGRPDLAGVALLQVRAPTLLIVGGADAGVLELNEEALMALNCEKRLEIVPHATHLFEEPGALDYVVRLTGDWFVHHLTAVEP